jgi:hypothetical protein
MSQKYILGINITVYIYMCSGIFKGPEVWKCKLLIILQLFNYSPSPPLSLWQYETKSKYSGSLLTYIWIPPKRQKYHVNDGWF